MARIIASQHLSSSSYSASSTLSKRPKRASLRPYGIPDSGRDLLALYLWWVNQRYYRAQKEMGRSPYLDQASSSGRSVVGAEDAEKEPASPGVPVLVTSALEQRAPITVDLCGVGGQFG